MEVMIYRSVPISRINEGMNGDVDGTVTSEDLKELQGCEGCYLLNGHIDDLDSLVMRGAGLGYVTNFAFDEETEMLRGDIYVTNIAQLGELIKGGIVQLSKSNIKNRMLHVALVKEGWAGEQCSIADVEPEVKNLDPEDSILSLLKGYALSSFMFEVSHKSDEMQTLLDERKASFDASDIKQQIEVILDDAKRNADKVIEDAKLNGQAIIELAQRMANDIRANSQAEASSNE